MISENVFDKQGSDLMMVAPETSVFTMGEALPDFGDVPHYKAEPLRMKLSEDDAKSELMRLSNAALAALDDDVREELGGDYLASDEAMLDQDGSNYLMGADLAKLIAGGDAYAAAESLIEKMPEAEREAARARLNACGKEADGCRLVGELWRKQVRGEYAEQQRKLHAADVILQKKMDGYVAGEAMGGGEDAAEDALSEAEMAQLGEVMDKKALDDARAVRDWMQTYVHPLNGNDAEYMMRNLDSLEDELYELIGEDEARAGMAYQALMRWAEGVQKSGKVGAMDEFVVAVGKKLSNWANPRVQAAFSTMPAVGAAGAINTGALASAGETIQEKVKDAARTQTSRAMLRAAINKGMEMGDDTGFWKGAARNAARMAGDSLLYFLPGGAGMVAGSLDTVVRGFTEGYDEMRLNGLSGSEAMGQTMIDTGVQTAVELLPWGRIGGSGLSGFLRKAAGKSAEKPGAFTRWLVKHTQKSTMRALVAEGVSNVIDEAILEPIAGGLMTYGAERTFDLLGVPHGQSRSWSESFDELAQIWTDPRQLAGLVMFTAGIGGATAPGVRENVKWFAKSRNMWLAEGLTPEQVDEVMASKDILAEGNKLVNEGWKNDPAGMRKRTIENNKAIKKRGEVLVLTGQGAMDSALNNDVLAPAYAGVWRAYADKGLVPYVEVAGDGKVRITKKDRFGKGNDVDLVLSMEDADAYLIHEFERVENEWLKERQRTEGADAVRDNLREFMMHNVSEVAGGAMLRKAEEKKAVNVEDITRHLPANLAELVKKQGGINRALAERISEWARGMIDGLMAEGASEADARMSRDYAEGAVMSLGDMEGFARSFVERGEIGELGEGAQTTLFRKRGGLQRIVDGMKVLGSTLFGVPGHATAFNVVEDVAESMLDEVVQARAQVLAGDGQMSYAEAEGKAWAEMAAQVERARAAVLKADKDVKIPVPKAENKMSVIEAFSAMATSKFILSSATPGWMNPMVAAMKANLTAAAAVDAMGRAWSAAAESDPDAVGALADVLDKVGVRVADALSEARIEQADVVAWTVASGIVMSHVNGPDGAGGMSVSKAVADAEDEEQAILEREAAPAEETVEEAKQESARAAVQAERLMEMQAAQGANAPAEMQGVFDGDNCAYNAAGGYWFGMIQKSKLVKSTEQVKVGTKGKHGVIAGRELTGNFQASAAPLYVWMRTNGELWLISGRHRYELMMRDNGVESHPCYVFREDAEHDEKWARMMDYENNMRDDQADELTAGTYVRETGLSDEELEVRGLMRNESRSKRGALIGRHAREELWTRFSNGKIKAKDAEVICNLTRYIKDQSRVDEIQRRCCMLLDNGKSWDYIGGMVQLMVQAELEQGQQGWFNFGADFEAALERAATWIEKALKAVNENIELAKRGRDMSGKKADKAARLGIVTSAGEDVQQTLQDLQVLKGKLELIGSYPELRQQAEMWDGESEVDPVGWMLQQQALENERMEAEKELEAEEYLKQQQAEATAEFSWSMEKRGLMPNQIKVKNKAIVTFNDGVVRDARSRVLRSNGSEVWARFPEIEELKEAGFPGADVFLEVGSLRGGFLHLAIRHGEEIQDLYPGVPLFNAIELFVDEVFGKLGKARGSYVGKGKKRKLDVDSEPYETNSGEKKKKRISLSFHKAPDAQFYTVDTAFEASADKEFAKVKVEKDGQSCTVTVELDGKAPGLPTSATLNPPSAWPLHARRPSEDEDITPGSNVKGEDIDFEFLREVKHPDVETGARGKHATDGTLSMSMERNLAAVSPEMDARYMEAVKRGDMAAAQRMVNDVARMRGYMPDSDYQGSECFNGAAPGANAYFDTDDERYEAWENGDFEGTVSLADFVRRGMDPGELEWLVTSHGAYQRADQYKRESIEAIRKAKASKRGKVTIYRAVPADIKEGGVRNGDWVTFSKAYAEYHISLQDWEKGRIIKQVVSIDDVWWDGNDVNEWGYDDGKEYAYSNTANNRKLLDAVTYDKNGDVVPLSKRFDYSSPDVSFSVVGQNAANWDKIKHRAFKGRDDGKLRVELDASKAEVSDKAFESRVFLAFESLVQAGYDETLAEDDATALAEYAAAMRELKALELELLNGEADANSEDFDKLFDKTMEASAKRKALRAAAYDVLERWSVKHGGKGASIFNIAPGVKDWMVEDFMAGRVSDETWKALNGARRKDVVQLGDVLDFPELYEAYPQLKKLTVWVDDLGKGTRGQLTTDGFGGFIITLNETLLDDVLQMRSTLLHEVQHAIQDIEGFAKGGNPAFARRIINNRASMGDIEAMELRKLSDMELYNRIAGEIESRNVQLRRNWTEAEREARPFNDTLEYQGEALVSFSMSKAMTRSMELLEARSEEEVAQQIMKDLRSACERLSMLLADDDVDARRGDGLKVYAEMQALISAVRQALPEKYLRQGNLEQLLRWASVYAKMATDGEVPARGVIKGDVYESFVAVLEKQQKQGQLHGMTPEESRDALMELAGEKLEVAFLKVARDSVRRIDQFLKDRALERIEWLYTHAYPTREEGRAWGRGKMESGDYRVINAAWQLVQNSLNKRKEAEEEMRLVRRQMVKVREQMKENEIEEGEGKRRLKKLREQLEQLELAAMQAAAEQQAQLIKSISEELESLDTDAADFSDKEAEANERMALQQTFGNWYYKDAAEARRAARVFEDMVLRGKKKWEEKLKVEREEIAYWREQILSGFEVSREEATNRRMKQRNALRTRLDKQLVGMGKGLMNFGHLMMALRPLLGKRFCDMKREQISQMHENTMAFNTELKNWMFRTLQSITGLKTEEEQQLWLAEQNVKKKTGIVITERATVKAALTYAEAKRWLGMSAAEREKERARMIAEAAAEKRKPSNVPTEEMMEELGQLVKEYEKDQHGVAPERKKFVVQTVEEWQTELHTTKDAILFGILTFEQPDYERLMEPNGITPEILDQMRRYVGPKMLRWGYAMREKLSEHGVNVARVFEEYTGIPFDARENYFKGVFDQGALKEQTLEDAVKAASGASGTGSKYGSLIPRRYHMSKINWDTSAASVFVTSMQQQNNYVQTSRMVRNWRALLTDKAFAARFEAEIGTAAKQQIIGWLELIEGAVVADVKMAELSNRMMRRMMGGYAKASLGGNVRTLIKQVSALLNGYAGGYVPDKWMLNNELCQEMTYRKIGFGEYMMALARVLSSQGSVSREDAKKRAFIYARQAVDGDGLLRVTYLAANQKLPGQQGEDGWLGMSEVPKGIIAWLGQKANKVVEKAMDAIAVVDAEMCTASAMAIADVAYRQAVAADVNKVVPDDVKRAEALRLAGMALDVAGQPQLRTQKSYWAASGALGGMGDFLFMFRSDTLSKAGLWIAQATSGEGKAAVGGGLAFGIMNSLVLAMLEGLRGNLGDDDDKWYQYLGAFSLDVLTNDATALPVVGDMLAKVRAGIMGEPVFESGLSDLVPFGEVFEYGKREVKNIRKGASWDRHWNATAGLLRAIGSSCAVCQDSTIGPLANLSSLTMAAAVFANSTKFVQGLIKLGEELSE